VGVQLRLWVELVSGREVEIHGVFLDTEEWDLSLGWRLNVLRIKYWQRVEPPQEPERPSIFLPEVRAVLREPKYFSGLTLFWGDGEVTLTVEELRRAGELRGAVWLWTGYESDRVPVSAPAKVPYTPEERIQMLRGLYHPWLFDLETRLTWIYHQLAHQELRGVNLEPDMHFFIEHEPLILKFGDNQLRALAGRVKERLRAEYVREKAEWIQRFGSAGLQRALALGERTEARYAKERAAREYPGFILSHPMRLQPTTQAIPLPLAVQFAPLVSPLGFQWYDDKDGLLTIAKTNFLGKYTVYQSFNSEYEQYSYSAETICEPR